MAITDPEQIPSEIKDQIEAAAFDMAKGFAWLWNEGGQEPSNGSPELQQLAQGFQRGLTAIAMLVL